MLYEEGLVSAFELWFKYGISPGSCGDYIIIDDYEGALRSSHPLLRDENGEFRPIYDAHRALLPPQCLTADWVGFENLDPEERKVLEFDAIMSGGSCHEVTQRWIKSMIYETNPKVHNPYYT